MSHPVFHDQPPASRRWIRQSFVAADGREVTVSVAVLRGAADGPVVAHVGGQHGMEHVGPIALREMVDCIDVTQLRGTVLICPAANPLALELNAEVYPENEPDKLPPPGEADLDISRFDWRQREDMGQYNLNRVWCDDIAGAGKPGEGLAQRIARWLWKTMIAPAQLVVDHHCVKDCRKPYVFVEEPSVPWTPLLGAEAVWCTGDEPKGPTPYAWQRLGLQSIRHGKVGIIIEYSAQRTIRPSDRAFARRVVLNTLRGLNMLPGQVQLPPAVWLIPAPYWEHLEEIRPAHVGHVHWQADEYDWLEAGQPIGWIADVQSNECVQRIVAPRDGLLLHLNPRALVRPSEWLCRFSGDAVRLASGDQPWTAPPLPVQSEPGA